LDSLLVALRNVIRDAGESQFPAEELDAVMARSGKSLRFEDDEIEDLLELTFNDRRTFAVLSILYPGMNFHNEFHVDHIFPRAAFARRQVANAGIDAIEADRLAVLANKLPNLQLLEGPLNESKSSSLPSDWIARAFPETNARAMYASYHDLGEIPHGVKNFEGFFNERRNRIAQRLRQMLSSSGVDIQQLDVPPAS
jgi:hypothetical protein